MKVHSSIFGISYSRPFLAPPESVNDSTVVPGETHSVCVIFVEGSAEDFVEFRDVWDIDRACL